MKLKKVLSLLLALALMVSAAAIATAESTDTTATETVTPDVSTADTTAADETVQAAEPVYTLDEMLTQAMSDAYQRQAAYAAYAEAFPDSRSIAGVDMDTQIVLLEMLLKANGVALPMNDAVITAPETQTDAYTAIAEVEASALTMYRSFLAQEDLAPDAQIIFNTVYRLVRSNAVTFAMKAQTAQQVEKFQELMNDENAQVYVVNNNHGRGMQVVYVVNNDQTTTDESTTDTTTQDTTEPAAEDSVSN